MISCRDKLERSVTLIPSAAALSEEDRAALVQALESLVGQHSGKLESPELKKRIAALTEIQGELKNLETNFFKERAALKAKQKHFQAKGYNYRLYTLKNNKIRNEDEEVLKYLKDIKCCKIGYSQGFKMEFIFDPNPHVKNSVLTKIWDVTNDNKPILEKAIGTEIKWYPGKSIFLGHNSRSFFKFFQPLEAADRIHRDTKIISNIQDDIIPQWHKMNEKKISRDLPISVWDEELLKTMFLGERAVLEGKYQKLYGPLYKKRYEIINGTSEVQEMKNVNQDGDKAREEKGVPYFWVTALKNVDVPAQKITKCDEGALKYLKDIKWCRINNSKGFKLEFFFDPNPYFKDTVITKEYHMSCDGLPMLEKTIGTNIKWHYGKSLTHSVLNRPKKRSKNAEFMTKQQSFFNFFQTPEYPGYWDYSTHMHHDKVRKIEAQFEVQKYLDYEVGKTIRDKIIPHAVSLFTGEAIERGTDCEDLDDDDDLYDEYYFDDDE